MLVLIGKKYEKRKIKIAIFVKIKNREDEEEVTYRDTDVSHDDRGELCLC